MTDKEIENRIWEAINFYVITNSKKDLNVIVDLNATINNDGFSVHWNDVTRWTLNDKGDPLGLLVFHEAPIPNTTLDDNVMVSTAATLLGKSIGWVRSFQDGIHGFKNKNTSISGYLLGYKIRDRVLKELDRKYLNLP